VILAYIKKQAERRDNDLWEMSLRMAEAESHIKEQTRILNMSYINDSKSGLSDCLKEVDSSPQVKRLLNNIDNSSMHTPQAVLD